MTARTIVITGASDGIGASAARTLSKQGQRIVVVGRSAEKTERVAKEIGADFFVSDFAELDQVRQLAAQLKEQYPRIDVLANNAGGIMGRRELTVDGHEKTFQINHLSPFLLTTELMDVLTASNATVINTSSAANSLFGKLDIDDLDAATSYSTNRAYGNAKLANILFTSELHNRYGQQGISTAAFHPGGVATNFAADSTSPMRFAYKSFLKRFMLTPDQGADTLVWLATAVPGQDWVPGAYYAKRALAKANKQAYSPELARELWDRSAAMVGANRDKLDSPA
ncbi:MULTISPECIES: SDR family NAD(P)-dependent oxidoreductase [unclassified Arthrobacter]|uniref:SDR family NAD(P)-dependent oxidoreductase n=1 Tax=unclassified Arthrobacter TaxID=235627 RepID=UPI002E001E1F|nr:MULTISPECIES: SDR family NAD(P)-dependent oxidoreductase [unclassified Arthrobacter]MEC5190240.1 NAD(P)-dependent dehydrogenase (short-subunit alcohol dehydrogenase family) [Arthrobacter sp. MP_M4]MEC5202613.1 NAD(P)-dependent dehydrogenase (short-subunit alcohol dehydrogenase family) [Arthrobacter sp. MP_M7]